MGMKKNNPGCGCCGSLCWSCSGDIASVTVDGLTTSNPCCEVADGTWVLDAGVCQDNWGVPQPYYPGCTVTAGSPTLVQLTQATTVGADPDQQYALICDGPQQYTTNNVTREVELVLHAYAILIEYADVAGTPTVTVTLRQRFREINALHDEFDPDPTNCSTDNGSEWVLTDTYTLSVTDCNTLNGIEIPHTSRTMTTTSTNPGDTTTIYYGPGGLFPTWPYSFCAYPTVTINMAP